MFEFFRVVWKWDVRLLSTDTVVGGMRSTDAGPGRGCGPERVAEAGPGSEGAEGPAGGDAVSGGRRLAPGAVQPRGDLQSAGPHLRAVFCRAAER